MLGLIPLERHTIVQYLWENDAGVKGQREQHPQLVSRGLKPNVRALKSYLGCRYFQINFETSSRRRFSHFRIYQMAVGSILRVKGERKGWIQYIRGHGGNWWLKMNDSRTPHSFFPTIGIVQELLRVNLRGSTTNIWSSEPKIDGEMISGLRNLYIMQTYAPDILQVCASIRCHT